jgi:hypothetical protein
MRQPPETRNQFLCMAEGIAVSENSLSKFGGAINRFMYNSIY